MSTLRHEMIFASAGSGKTFALTTRFIRLLALGAAPERIVALTFTRKAAGEFFGEILNRLAAASADEKKARSLAVAVERPELTAADFLKLLRGMIGAMHRLNLGTLDGFFAKIVRAFPLELGLGGEPGLLDAHGAAEEMRRVLAQLFASRGGLTPEQHELIEAFRLATFGTEGKSVAESFDRFVAEHLALYRAAPELAKWGTAARLWPRGFPWSGVADDAATARAAEELIDWANGAGLAAKHCERLVVFARAALEWTPGQPWSREITYVAEKVLAEWSRFDAAAAAGVELKFDRAKITVPPAVVTAIAALVRRLVGLELGRRMVVTQGIAKVMRTFDALYDAEVRRAGRLTFADLQQLLSPERAAAGGEFDRAGLDYRIDARLDHWLFDEFQDTSYQQWKILERLVDEVVQDPEGRRSLFYVGDVKQAIFTWREGDPRLFAHVAERYRNTAGGGVVAGELNDSWRSGPELIEMVNRVCGDKAVIAELFPEAAPEWNRHWREHRSARPENRGQAALLLADDEAGRWAATLRLLQEIRPTERGLTCAVLVRKNDVGARLADYLRREGGIAAVAEADLRIGADNPAALALAALLQVAAHPNDGFAKRQVAMAPLAALLAAELGECRAGDAAELSRAVLGALEADGFEAWLAAWVRRLEPVLPADDGFTRLRLRQLVAAGRTFDETGARNVDEFLRFLSEYTVREPEGAGMVRVMTVHKSKGLGFDVVILPDLEGQKLAQRRDGPAVRKAADRSIEWILQYPGTTIAENDPVLREYLQEAVAENCYEQLSLLYVALTRAKRAMYAVIERPGKSASLNFPKLLTATLGGAEIEMRVGTTLLEGAWSAGGGDWFAGLAVPPVRSGTLPVSENGDRVVGRPVRRSLTARRPSGLKPAQASAERLFACGAGGAAQFGIEVHALLAEIEWASGAESALPGESGLAEGGVASQVRGAARLEAAGCLGAAELQPVFAKENDGDEVWRERAFEAVIDGAWVSGVLDRVVIRRVQPGACEVAIYDFKTERVPDLARLHEQHAAQLAVYRAVVARLVDVAEPAVRCFLVATGSGRLIEIVFPLR